MAFNKTDLDSIKSKILISTELEKKTKIIKKGKDTWCCCPFHNEKTPSCKINDDLGSFYCFIRYKAAIKIFFAFIIFCV